MAKMQFFAAVLAIIAALLLLLSGPTAQVGAAPLDSLSGHVSDRAALPALAATNVVSLHGEADCDGVCRQRILYYCTYASASMGITMVMEAHDAWAWCGSAENESWCPGLMNSTASATAQKVVARSTVLEKDCDAACLLEELAVTSQHAAYLAARWAMRQVRGLNASEENVDKLDRIVDDLSHPPQRPLFEHDDLRHALARQRSGADLVARDRLGGDNGNPSLRKALHVVGYGTLGIAAQLLLGPFVASPCNPLTARDLEDGICDPENLEYPGNIRDELLQGNAGDLIRQVFNIAGTTKYLSSRTWFNRMLRAVRELREGNMQYTTLLEKWSLLRDQPEPVYLNDIYPLEPDGTEPKLRAPEWDTLADDGNLPLDGDWLESSKSKIYRAEDFEAGEGRLYQRVLRLLRTDEFKGDHPRQLLEQGYRPFEELDRFGNARKLVGAKSRAGRPRYHWNKASEMKIVDADEWRKIQARWYSQSAAAEAADSAEGSALAGAAGVAEAADSAGEAAGEAAGSAVGGALSEGGALAGAAPDLLSGLFDSLAQPVVPLGPTEFANVRPRPRANPGGPVEYRLFDDDDPSTEVGRLVTSVDGSGENDAGLCMMSGGLMPPACHEPGAEHSVGMPEHHPSGRPVDDYTKPAGAHTAHAAEATSARLIQATHAEYHHDTSSGDRPTSSNEHHHTSKAKHHPTTSTKHTHTTSEKPEHTKLEGHFRTIPPEDLSSSTMEMHYATMLDPSLASSMEIRTVLPAGSPHIITTTFVTYTTFKHDATWWDATETLMETTLPPKTSMHYTTASRKHHKTHVVALGPVTVTPTTWVTLGGPPDRLEPLPKSGWREEDGTYHGYE